MYLPYLDYFRSVAKYESMTKAADHLHISQPALSQTIIKLEDELGVQLFHRSKGRLSLTVAGKLYYECVERAFSELEKGARQMQTFHAASREAITVISTFPHLLCEIVNRYASPGIGLTINPFVYSMNQSIQKLIHRSASFAILPFCRPKQYNLEGEVLRQHKVMEEPLLVVVGRNHPLAALGTISLNDLKCDQFVVNEQNFDQESFLSIFSAATDYLPQILLNSNETRMINPLVGTGKAVYLAPASDVMRDMSEQKYQEEMVALQIQERPTRAIFICKLEDTVLSPPAQEFYDFILEFFREQEHAVETWSKSYFQILSDLSDHA